MPSCMQSLGARRGAPGSRAWWMTWTMCQAPVRLRCMPWRALVHYVVDDVASTGTHVVDDVASTGTLAMGDVASSSTGTLRHGPRLQLQSQRRSHRKLRVFGDLHHAFPFQNDIELVAIIALVYNNGALWPEPYPQGNGQKE
jgi:hypothetical protein